MKKVLIDLNVILDFLAKRQNHKEAAIIFGFCENKTIKGYVCAHEITTLSYFITDKFKNKKGASKIINDILDLFSTIPINETILRSALTSKISDFEDAVIEQSSIKEKLDYIVTNNLTDFKSSAIKAITPIELISILKNS